MPKCIWLFLAYLATVIPAVAETRVALIVANSAYETAPLSNPTIDAALVKTALNGIGFTTTVVENVKIEEFESALSIFAQQAKGAEIALFYYAGHGFAVSDRGGPRNFLMGVDADVTTTSERALRAYGLPLDDVVGAISETVSTTLIFIDACRNDPSISRAVGGRGRGAVPIDRAVGENVLVGLSTRLGEVAADGDPGQGSPFARAFSANIIKAGIRVDDAFTQARLAVMQETNRQQRPDIGRYDLETPIVLVPTPSAQPSVTDADDNEELKAYNEATAVGSCGAFQAFAKRYPNSFYAELAVERANAACSEPGDDLLRSDDPASAGALSISKSASPSLASTADGPPKFTQRLATDGTEIDAGPGSSAGDMSVAIMTQPARGTDRLVGVRADTSGTNSELESRVPVEAIYYEEKTTNQVGSKEPGSVEWSLVQESPGANLPPEAAIRAEVTIPGKDIRMRMTIRRNADETLEASHVIELIFLTPDGFPGIEEVRRIAMKRSETDAGAPLIGLPVKVADGFFLVGLNSKERDRDINLALLREKTWIDIAVVYESGRRALVTIEKGASGLRVFEDVFVRANRG